MKVFEKFLEREATRSEVNKMLLVLTLVGFIVITLAKEFVCTGRILLTQDCVVFWIGVDAAVAGIIGLIVNNVSEDYNEG